ncbi:MAG TPA: PQQ-dependent sugar dehydrogenase [Acidimicrobiia bacterium]|nr:PQQ-dependent sugar dehydrogenase [Acidimicrobiia bacterium]
MPPFERDPSSGWPSRLPAHHHALRLFLGLAVLLAVLAPVTPAAAAPAFHGSLGGLRLRAPIVGMDATPSGAGYVLAATDGGVFTFGDARFRGSMGGVALTQPVVDVAHTPTGSGYYLAAADGGVFTFGAARFRGSTGGVRLVAPVLAMDVAPDNAGYLLLAADGGVFAFGSARFRGSLGGRPISALAVDIVMRPQGDGYWIVLANGEVHAFGGARFLGQPRGILHGRVVGIDVAPDGNGYAVATSDGGVYTYGSAKFFGSAAGARLPYPMVDLALRPQNDGYWLASRDGGIFTFPGRVPLVGTPKLAVTTVASGLSHVWDLGFLPDGAIVFTQRAGSIDALVGGVRRTLATPGDVVAGGEGGMLGLAIDPQFATNRHIYTCYNTAVDVRVVKWRVNAGVTALTRVGDLVSGIPRSATGRHSGCRPRFGPDGFLWIGTGDAASGTNPQDENTLAGKVLRVDKVTGAAAPGNPGGRRWYTKGHRNVQGLAFRPGSGAPYSAEHGTNRDDEVNRLLAGGNYGWDPVPGYNEAVPMTDFVKFPNAVGAVWSSGFPTIAPSGITFLSGQKWRDWNGAIAMAVLAGQHLRVLRLDAAGTAVTAQVVALSGYGRMRSVVLGPDRNLYVTTSNGGGTDRILRITPS